MCVEHNCNRCNKIHFYNKEHFAQCMVQRQYLFTILFLPLENQQDLQEVREKADEKIWATVGEASCEPQEGHQEVEGPVACWRNHRLSLQKTDQLIRTWALYLFFFKTCALNPKLISEEGQMLSLELWQSWNPFLLSDNWFCIPRVSCSHSQGGSWWRPWRCGWILRCSVDT